MTKYWQRRMLTITARPARPFPSTASTVRTRLGTQWPSNARGLCPSPSRSWSRSHPTRTSPCTSLAPPQSWPRPWSRPAGLLLSSRLGDHGRVGYPPLDGPTEHTMPATPSTPNQVWRSDCRGAGPEAEAAAPCGFEPDVPTAEGRCPPAHLLILAQPV